MNTPPTIHHAPGPLAAAAACNWRRRFTAAMSDQARHMRRRWYVYLPLLLIWSLAYVRVFIDPTPRIPLLFNWTASLPYQVAWLHRNQRGLQRGDHVVFRFDGPAQSAYPGLKDQPFFKRIQGLPGDRITVVGQEVFINGTPVGAAKPFTFDRRPLRPISAGVIPAGHYYVQGLHADSFDSRYQDSGLVRQAQILGRVRILF